MAGKTYNAGTIFLQVVPVFGDVQNAIRRQVGDINKTLGDELEKGGEDAGRRASEKIGAELEKGAKRDGKVAASAFQKEFDAAVKGMSKSLEPINLRFQSNEVTRQIQDIRGQLEMLSDVKIKTELDAKRAEAEIRVLSAQLQGLQEDAKINAKLDIKRAVAAAAAFEKQLDSLQKAADIEVRMETKQAERQLGAFEKRIRATARKAADSLGDSMNPAIRRIKRELDGLADAEIGIDISDEQARKKIEDLMRETRRLAWESPEIQVKVDAGRAEAELAALYAQMKIIDGDDINIDVDVNAGAAAAKLGLLRSAFTASGADAGANSFRAFNVVVLAAVTLLPALIPVIGAVGGALMGLLPIMAAVGAGFGAMLVGFSGIGDAVGALADHANDSAKDTHAAAKTIQSASYAVADARLAVADAERNAARASADAARQVADARRSAADAIEDAIDRQREAQEAYRDSVQDVREAEADLREARKRAAEEQAAATADTKDRIRQNQLDIREAVLGAFDATNTYNAVMADGSSTAYDKEAAEVAMLQARERLHELRDLEKELAAQRKEQRKEGVNDSAAVESAQDALTAALERQRDAQEAVGEAAEAVNEARIDGARRIQDAIRAQSRAEADGARSVARAQEQLRRAQEAYGNALYETGELGSSSMQKLEEAMGKLGPAGRRFARFLFSLRDEWFAFRSSIQEAMLPGVQRALQGLISTYGPQFTAFMTEMGAVTGRFFERFSESLQGPAWRRFFGIMEEIGPRMAAEFGDTTINWLETFANIMTAVAPFAERMSKAMLGMSEAVAKWSESEKGQAAITRFMEYAAEVGPAVLDFLGSFISAAINLGVALAPWGKMVMEGLTALLDWIAAMDPDLLGMIAGAIIGVVIAWQAAVGATAAFLGGMSAFQTFGSRLIFSVVGISAVVAILALRFEGVRDALKELGGFISDHRELLMKLATAVLVGVAAYKTYRFIMATVAAVQIGLAAATYGAVGATYAQGFAAKATYTIMRIWHGATLAMAVAQRILNLTLLGFPLVWIIVAVAAVVAAIVLLWQKNETFREVMTKAWNGIKKAVDVAWGVIKAVIKGIGTAIGWLWKNIVKPYLGWIGSVFTSVFKGIVWAWKNILWPIIDLIGTVIWELFKFFFAPVLRSIGEGWDKLMTGMKWVWEHILKPVWDKMKDGLDLLKDRFSKSVENIEGIWERLRKIIGAPIKFVIETVLNNGLIAGFNKVAEFVGSDKMGEIPVPEWTYARGTSNALSGGTLPGYSPGRDIHEFYSPTAGHLKLSGGEAILRPEATMALGPEWVDQVNRAARFGGARGVRRALGGYWMGGVLPLFGSRVDRHESGYSGYAADFNVGSGSDDYGLPVRAWKAGIIAAMRFNGSGPNNPLGSYGRWMDVNHAGGQYSRYAHLSAFAAGLRSGAKVAAGQTLGYVGSIGNSTAPHLHFEINGGNLPLGATETGGGGGGFNFPGWLVKLAKNPLDYVKNLVSGPIDAVKEKFGSNKMIQYVTGLPGKLIGAVKDKVWDMVPGPVKNFVGGVKDAVAADKGDYTAYEEAYRNGGILPYNGTMMYDSGGYLPPGITQVVNMTGKPEPVLTNDQFRDLRSGDGAPLVGSYAPVFQGSDLGADDVLDEFEFTIRKLGRKSGGKYEGTQS